MTVTPIVVWALGTFSKDLEKRQEELKTEEESKLSTPQQCKNHREYWGESWRPEKSCGRSGSSKRPIDSVGIKNMHEINESNNSSNISLSYWNNLKDPWRNEDLKKNW